MTEVPDGVSAGLTRRVDVGSSSYPVVICDDAPAAVAAHVRGAFPHHACCLISDDVVAPLYAERIARVLSEKDRKTRLLTFPSGESSKSRDVWALLTDAMIDARFGRDTVVVAVGGGVTGDLAGFVAATYQRGVPVVQVPTSLVAMVDSAIGGKTAIDAAGGKNLIGAFHQPSAVIVDVGALRTLPPAHRREGLVEAIKHGAIEDADYFDWILARARAITAGDAIDPDDAHRLVVRSIEIKTAVVSGDPLEHGHRAVLNFGHTVGHAIEHASGYAVGHGRAIASGMVVEAGLGEAMGITRHGTAARLEEATRALDMPPLPALDPHAILRAAGVDKKNRAGAVRCTLLRAIGEVARAADGSWTHEVSADQLARHLAPESV